MLNVDYKVADDLLHITINLKKDFGPSKSKKTIVVATTQGNKKIEGTDCIIGLNVYKYPEGE